MTLSKSYEYYLQADLGSYPDEWVALCDNRVVSHGKDAKRVYEEARRKCPKGRPLLTRVPGKETLIF